MGMGVKIGLFAAPLFTVCLYWPNLRSIDPLATGAPYVASARARTDILGYYFYKV